MAVATAALDTGHTEGFDPPVSVIVLPTDRSEPLGLLGDGAEVWRRLAGPMPVPTGDLSPEQAVIARQLAASGLVALGVHHPSAVRTLEPPHLSSPLHELVWALVARVAEERGIRCVFIKGPTLHDQGLRDREHSGDVDVWCDPRRWVELIEALQECGWQREPDPWWGTPIGHSATLSPTGWGCQIDVHRRMPGMTFDDESAFELVVADTVAVRMAGIPVLVPSRTSHAVIAALHAARPEIGRPREADSPSRVAIDLLQRLPDPVTACRRLGAVPALRHELDVCRPGVTLVDDGVPRDWFWRAQPDRVRAYAAALRELDLADRFRVALRLVWPAPDVARESARRAGEETDRPLAARLRRLRRGLVPFLSGWLLRKG
ncbi:hypothetical protein AVW09_05300 [Microbacterium sp. T32]|nr:hypothetical protein AVW09_05300 [Microbacterium sp. T32]